MIYFQTNNYFGIKIINHEFNDIFTIKSLSNALNSVQVHVFIFSLIISRIAHMSRMRLAHPRTWEVGSNYPFIGGL